MNRGKKAAGKGGHGPKASAGLRQTGENKENVPPTRRPKASTKKASAKKQTTSISFLDLPLDPAFIVFSMLHPQDLLSLARVSKTVRRTLIDTRSSVSRALWREKRQEVGAPDPPPELTEAKWLTFLFGWHCYSCGTAKETLADFYLLKRLCVDCKETGCTNADEYRASGGGQGDLEVLNFVLHSPKGPYNLSRGGRLPYWASDVQEMAAVLARLKSLAKQDTSTAVEALEQFKSERLRYVATVRALARQVEQWVLEFVEKQNQQELEVRERLVSDLRQRFSEIGTHDALDIDKAITLNSVRPTLRRGAERIVLTDKVWRRYRPRLERLIEDARKKRHEATRHFRALMVEHLWKVYGAAMTVDEAELDSYPPFYQLLQRDSGLAEAINSNLDRELTQEEFQILADMLPEIASNYVAYKQTELVGRVRCVLDLSSVLDVDLLELATSVFVPCESDDRPHIAGVLVGWKMLSAFHDHGKDHEGSFFPEPSSWLSEISRSLVTMCGLDGRTATVEDMDKVDQRFFCVPCILESISNIKSLPRSGIRLWNADIFTWTAALLHARIHHDVGRGTCSPAVFGSLNRHLRFRALRPHVNIDETSQQRDSGQGRGVWACNHCEPFVSTSEHGMISHLETSHYVDIPQIEADYHLDKRVCFDHLRPCQLDFQVLPGEDEVQLRVEFERMLPSGSSNSVALVSPTDSD